jgi:small subunit ribosomal protein S16
MTRAGSKRKPFYRFVVIDSKAQRDGGFLDWVGHYNPIAKPHEIKVDEAKVSEWIGKGATMSEGVRSLLKKAGTLAKMEAARREPAGQAPAEGAGEAGETAEAGEESAP